jgi:hypothetical protein
MVRAGGHRAGNRRTKDFQRPFLLSVSFLLALLPVLAAVVDDAAELSLAPPPPHPMVDIFVHGDGGFPCWRVPAVVMAKSTGRLFAFAEARNYSGDGCEPDGLKPNASHPNEGPRSLALKTSTNDGRSWSELRIVDWNGINPAAVYDERTDQVVVHYPAAYWGGGTGHPVIGGDYTKQLLCSADGSCGAPTSTALYWPGCAPTPDPHCRMHIGAGPGLGTQLTVGPHAGRLLFAGHAGQVDVVWYSDDGAKSWTVARSTFGSNNASKAAKDGPWGCGRPHGCYDEPFPVQLPSGLVQLNMRNNSLSCDPKNCCCAYLPIVSSLPDPSTVQSTAPPRP